MCSAINAHGEERKQVPEVPDREPRRHRAMLELRCGHPADEAARRSWRSRRRQSSGCGQSPWRARSPWLRSQDAPGSLRKCRARRSLRSRSGHRTDSLIDESRLERCLLQRDFSRLKRNPRRRHEHEHHKRNPIRCAKRIPLVRRLTRPQVEAAHLGGHRDLLALPGRADDERSA